MNALEKTEKQIEHEKKRLKEAGTQVLGWLERSPPNRLAHENPWLLAGVAAALGAGLGFVVAQRISGRSYERD